MVLGQSRFQELEAFLGRVSNLEQVKVLRRNHSGIDHGVEIHDFLPILAAVYDDQNLFGEFLGLGEGEDFEKFVQRAEAAREDDQGLGKIGEPELAHEEIVE